MNSDAPSISWPSIFAAERRVLEHQLKLHRWARAEPERRFSDVFNLICDRSTLLVAWERVSGNQGARTAGVDAVTRHHVEDYGVIPFLEELRSSLKDGSFTALPVKQAVIPKKGGKVRYLGIPTLRDRVAQGGPQAGSGADFRGRFLPVQLRVSAWPSGSGCHRRDPPSHQPLLRVGGGRGYHRMLRL
ncbi:hypothetical protein ACFXMT_36500 [Streptomyces mirabilis]|uniref:hypothetical protein n=1 Tax=Streptomyces mirabilis TaxID=68239 RepID=UPI0036A43DEA